MDIFSEFLFGSIDENKQHYTAEHFEKEKASFLLCVLVQEGILDEKTVERYKEEWMKTRNEMFTDELKKYLESLKKK